MASGKAGRKQRAANTKRAADSKRFEKTMTRICVGLVIAGPVLGIAAGALGAAEVYPSDYMIVVALGVMLGLIGLGLLIAACAGLYVLGGWVAAPFGVVFVAGFGALVYGIGMADTVWRDVGVVLLAVSAGSFVVAPALRPRPAAKARPRVPDTSRKPAGVLGVIGVGAVIAAFGYILDVWWVLLFGAMAVGTAAGAGIAMWLDRRRREPAD